MVAAVSQGTFSPMPGSVPVRAGVPRRRPWVPRNPPTPPALLASSEARMGQRFDVHQILPAVVKGGIGVGAMVLSKALPGPFDIILGVAGVGMMGWAAFSLFSGGPVEPSRGVEATEPVPITPKEAFDQLEGKIVSPKSFGEEEASFWSLYYPMVIELTNPSDQTVFVTMRIVANEKSYSFLSSDPVQETFAVIQAIKVLSVPPGSSKNYEITPQIQAGGAAASSFFVDAKLEVSRQGGDVAGITRVLDKKMFVVAR
jgi:hypothetical protein